MDAGVNFTDGNSVWIGSPALAAGLPDGKSRT